MKDAYSYHSDEASLDETYNDMYQAYSNIFSRVGLNYRAVEADSGSIGGSHTHEFMALSEIGEDIIVSTDESGYAANIEKAACIVPAGGESAAHEALGKGPTAGVGSSLAVAEDLNIDLTDTT